MNDILIIDDQIKTEIISKYNDQRKYDKDEDIWSILIENNDMDGLEYMHFTSPLVERFKELLERFKELLNELKDTTNQYYDIIKETFFEYKKYIKDEIGIVCEYCKSVNTIVQGEKGMYCKVCSCEYFSVARDMTFQDVSRVNSRSTTFYDRTKKFNQCMEQYQAIQPHTVPKSVYDNIKKCIKEQNLLDEKGGYSKLTKKQLYSCLKTLKYSKYYKDTNLIHFVMTGTKSKNISHLKEQLFQDFSRFQEAYEKHYEKNGVRKYIINMSYILHKLLLKNGYECSEDEFIEIKNKKKSIEYRKICLDLFKKLGWKGEILE